MLPGGRGCSFYNRHLLDGPELDFPRMISEFRKAGETYELLSLTGAIRHLSVVARCVEGWSFHGDHPLTPVLSLTVLQPVRRQEFQYIFTPILL